MVTGLMQQRQRRETAARHAVERAALADADVRLHRRQGLAALLTLALIATVPLGLVVALLPATVAVVAVGAQAWAMTARVRAFNAAHPHAPYRRPAGWPTRARVTAARADLDAAVQAHGVALSALLWAEAQVTAHLDGVR